MRYINELLERYPCLLNCKFDIEKAVTAICEMNKKDGKLLLCGNGGSACDCDHISGELLKGFLLERKPYSKNFKAEHILPYLQNGVPAIPLSDFSALITAFSNDCNPVYAFAQLVFVLGKKEDILLTISTSGNSENIIAAAETAKAKGLITIALTGKHGGKLSDICDITIRIPQVETHKVQELHLPVYHAICAQIEENLFNH